MKPNVGTADRIIRIIVAAGLMAAALSGAIGAWGWIGVVPLLTGLVRICPAYLPFGFSTCATRP